MSTEIEAVWPGLAKRSPLHRAIRRAQNCDVEWFMARPAARERVRPAIPAEQRMCMELTTEPVTRVRVWQEDVHVKYEGWTSTFRWDAY